MNSLETIDRLCAVVREQAEIIHAQALFIEEQQTVDAALKQEFAAQRGKVERTAERPRAISLHNAARCGVAARAYGGGGIRG